MNIKSHYITVLISILSYLFNTSQVQAQSYYTIDDELGLYCADLPDGTNLLVSVTTNGGLSTINTLDPQAEKANIIKIRKQIQKRISTLASIKKDYNPSSDGAKLKQVFKFVINEVINELDSDNTLESTKPNKIFNKISLMILELKNRLSELDEAIQTIDRCLRNEDLLPPPERPSTQAIAFSFKHPDYGTTEIMRGVGVTALLHKKRFVGTVCVSAEKSNARVPKFPKEAAIGVVRNPCLAFFQTSFRNFPICHYGTDPNTAVGWIGSSSASVGFSSTFDDDDLKSLTNYAESHKFTVRIPTKKKPCRTK